MRIEYIATEAVVGSDGTPIAEAGDFITIAWASGRALVVRSITAGPEFDALRAAREGGSLREARLIRAEKRRRPPPDG